MPAPPGDLSEPQYTRFLFTNKCYVSCCSHLALAFDSHSTWAPRHATAGLLRSIIQTKSSRALIVSMKGKLSIALIEDFELTSGPHRYLTLVEATVLFSGLPVQDYLRAVRGRTSVSLPLAKILSLIWCCTLRIESLGSKTALPKDRSRFGISALHRPHI